MKYPFMTFPDDTEITHSSIYMEEGLEKVKVYIERPVEGGFVNATCVLPSYSWENNGFSKDDLQSFQRLLEKSAHVIYKFARQGGFGNAANF